MQERRVWVWLAVILVLAALLRFVGLNQVPPSLNWDEISHGYNAYSILKTGRDEWGQLVPVTNFRAYGDYPLPLNLYLTIPFEILFGLNQTAIRLPHALLGTLTVVAVYFLVVGVTKNEKMGLMASLLAAIEPWFLFPSRAVFQSNLSVFFLIAGMAAFFMREKKKWLMPLSFLFLGLTLFSYHSTRIFTPLLLIPLVITYRKVILKSRLSAVLILLFFLPLPFILLSPQARARSGVVFLIDQGAINRIESERTNLKLPNPLPKLLINKVTYFGVTFSKNYINYFSPNFLFLNGGTQYQFSVPNNGLLYLISSPFFYIGLILLAKRAIKEKDYRILFIWLLLAPIPAAITQDSSAVIRATTMLPIPEILTVLGFYEIVRRFSKYEILLTGVFVFLTFLCFENYMNVYATSYRVNYSWSWQYGYKEVVDYVKENYSKYDEIITTKAYGEPHEYFLFFLQYDPKKYMSDPNLIRFYQSSWYWVDHFDKFWFVNDWQVKDLVTESKHKIDCGSEKCLVITTADNAPKGFRKIDEVKFLDGKTAFEMYTN